MSYFDDFDNLNSIISKERKCFFCGSREKLEIHHVFGGSLREKSTKYGLFVFLCQKCHKNLHFGANSRSMTDKLKSVAQEAFERKYGKEKFLKEFHANFKKEIPSIEIGSMDDLANGLKEGKIK